MYKSTEELKQILRPIFQKHQVRNAVLFGSYAKGTQKDNSDLDIAVTSELRGLAFFGLLEDVCNAVDVPVDLIDTQEIIPDGELDREIQKTGVPLVFDVIKNDLPEVRRKIAAFIQ